MATIMSDFENYPSYDDGAIFDAFVYIYHKSAKSSYGVLKSIKTRTENLFSYLNTTIGPCVTYNRMELDIV